MNSDRFLHTIDGISTFAGKAAAWLIMGLMLLVCAEVFKRYILNMPTAWIFDASNMLYGAAFMLGGAYTLAQNAHVRGDFLYSSMRPRTQAGLDLVLYIVFFLPGIAALAYAGWDYAALSWRINEHSNVTADGPPVYHFKAMIPLAGILLLLQGSAEIARCVICLQDRRVAEPPQGRQRNRRRRGAAGAERACRRRNAQKRDRACAEHRGERAPARHGRSVAAMSDPALGLLMLGLIVVVIIMGFPTAFTLMGLGMFFGFFAYYSAGEAWADNHIFDLMVQRTYGAMTNDVLISIPLFVLMGYVMERGALVDKMFYAIQLAFRRVPAALAVASLIVCTFWGIASGLVGAVVVLMGVIAFNPMLKAGYDVKLASGVITAGGTLGILIPPSVMIIVYAAVAGQSVVKLYAAAMFPSFFLAFLYLVYIIGWALINPKIAPKLPESETRVPVRPWVAQFQQSLFAQDAAGVSGRRRRARRGRLPSRWMARGSATRTILKSLAFVLVPLVLALGTLWSIWWYVVIHQQPDAPTAIERSEAPTPLGQSAPSSAPVEEKLEELGSSVQQSGPAKKAAPEVLQQMGNLQSETSRRRHRRPVRRKDSICTSRSRRPCCCCCCSTITGSWRPSSSKCCGC